MVTRKNAALYIPLLQALAEGKTLQRIRSGGWSDLGEDYILSFALPVERYRIKPDPIVQYHVVSIDNPASLRWSISSTLDEAKLKLASANKNGSLRPYRIVKMMEVPLEDEEESVRKSPC